MKVTAHHFVIGSAMRLSEIEQLLANTADSCFAVDELGRIVAWNGAAEAMFALSGRDAVGMRCNEIVQGADENGPVCSATCATQLAARNRDPVSNFDLQVRTANGVQWCNVSVLIAEGEDADGRYSIHIVRQVDVRKRLELLILRLLAGNFDGNRSGVAAAPGARPASSPRTAIRSARLSARETEVLNLLGKGVTTKSISAQLHVSRSTINNHVQHILHKLGAHSRLEAIRRAEQAGLI